MKEFDVDNIIFSAKRVGVMREIKIFRRKSDYSSPQASNFNVAAGAAVAASQEDKLSRYKKKTSTTNFLSSVHWLSQNSRENVEEIILALFFFGATR